MADRLKKSLKYSVITLVMIMAFVIMGDMTDALFNGGSFEYSAIWHLSFPTACAALDFVILYFGNSRDDEEKECMGISCERYA